MYAKMIIALFLTGCATSGGGSDFETIHYKAKNAENGETCYVVQDAIGVNGAYCLQYFGENFNKIKESH